MRVLAIVAPNLPVKDTRPVEAAESAEVVQMQSELSRILQGDGPFEQAA
jgi:hypothetical protein